MRQAKSVSELTLSGTHRKLIPYFKGNILCDNPNFIKYKENHSTFSDIKLFVKKA